METLKCTSLARAGLDQFGARGKNLAGAPCMAANSTSNHCVHTLTQKTGEI